MEKYQWGIIGTGEIAEQFAQGFKSEESQIYGVAARNFEKTVQFAQKHDIPKSFETTDELIADPSIHIIYIAVPNQLHYPFIKKALQHGKHVLCEKTITLSKKELDELSQLAKEKRLILQEAMTIFNMPLYTHLKKLANENHFGQLKMIQAPFGSYKEPDPTNRFFNPDLAGGALLDIGTYAVSFARFFMSEAPKVICSAMLPFQTGVDEQSITLLQNEKNEMASVNLSFQAKMPKIGIVAYENAYLTIPDYPRSDFATITHLDGRVEDIQIGDTREALNYEVQTIIHAIQSGVNSTLALTQDVIGILDDMRQHWQQ